MKPLVSVILISYNHERWVKRAIQSVLDQTYPSIELIIADDASTDNTQQTISECIRDKPEITFIAQRDNKGNCKTFNRAFKESSGAFIIDLAADDVLLPQKVEKQVNAFLESSSEYGVMHHDIALENEEGRVLGNHSDHVDTYYRKPVPDGWIFHELISHYIVASQSLMIRREVLEDLHGFDENLSYEDFDFWIRSSIRWKYKYIPEVLMRVTKIPSSMSGRNSGRFDLHSMSTLEVCKKILGLTQEDSKGRKELKKRVRYEMRQAFLHGKKSTLQHWFHFGKSSALLTIESRLLAGLRFFF